MLQVDSHGSNLKASGDSRSLAPDRNRDADDQSAEFLILGGLILLQMLLVWA